MKYLNILFLVIIILFSVGCECEEPTEEPDLEFKTTQSVFNPCLGYNETLDTRNLYWAPIVGTYQWILLYFREDIGFFDCYGYQWFISPGGTVLYSYRYLENVPKPGKECTKPAEQPSAQAFLTVTDPSGGTVEYDGPIVSFGNMNPGEVKQLTTQISISSLGVYINEYKADPIDIVLERNEDNNVLVDRNFDVNGKVASPSSFSIEPFDEGKLRRSGKPCVIYKEGRVRKINH